MEGSPCIYTSIGGMGTGKECLASQQNPSFCVLQRKGTLGLATQMEFPVAEGPRRENLLEGLAWIGAVPWREIPRRHSRNARLGTWASRLHRRVRPKVKVCRCCF